MAKVISKKSVHVLFWTWTRRRDDEDTVRQREGGPSPEYVLDGRMKKVQK